MWDTDTGEHKASVVGHRDDVNAVVFSPDGQLLATASDDDTVGLWDLNTGEWKARLEGHTEHVYSVAFSPDGAVLASSAAWGDIGIRFWDPRTATSLNISIEGTDWVEHIAYAPDGRTLVSGDTDDTLRFLGPQHRRTPASV